MPTPTIVTRASKGSPLTYTELDANFTNLRDAVGSGGSYTSDTTQINITTAGTTNLTFTNQVIYLYVTASSGTVTINLNDAYNHSLQPLVLIIDKVNAGATISFVYNRSGDSGVTNASVMFAFEQGAAFFDIMHNPLLTIPISFHRRNAEGQNHPKITTPSVINNLTSTDLAAVTGYFGAIAVETNAGVGTLKYWDGSAWVSSASSTAPTFSAYPSSAQTIASSGTQSKVNFGTEEYDTNSNFASSRFTPTVAGYYQLDSTVRLDGGGPGTGECMIVIWKNGSEYKRGWNSSGTSFANDFFSMSVSCQAYANGSTDYFEVYVQQVSGGNRLTTPYSNISYFQGCWLRA